MALASSFSLFLSSAAGSGDVDYILNIIFKLLVVQYQMKILNFAGTFLIVALAVLR